jgi:hypothetical protein
MRAIASRAGGERNRIALILAVVVAMGLLHVVQPLHLHRGASAGLYNEEHVLSALESVTGDAPLPDEPPGVGIDLAPTPTPMFVRTSPPAPALDSTRSRAPPLA